MDIHTIFAFVGFMFAAYSVIGNDSVQTLGTFIASNQRTFKWQILWLATAAVLVVVISYGWVINDGDISYGRLKHFPQMQVEWYHAAAPFILVLLTRTGIPVSTTFLVLSAFASNAVLSSMLVKSATGYALAAVVSYAIWLILSRFINEKFNKVSQKNRKYWRIAQWMSTGFLWSTWLAHDMANIAVFLPRQLSLELLIGVLAVLVFWLGYIFKTHGGKIQNIVKEKTGSRYIRSATIIDLVYALILVYFKEINSIPMSTTWVFVGVLCGRELAIASTHQRYVFKNVFPLIGRDFVKMLIGLTISIAMVVAIHQFFKEVPAEEAAEQTVVDDLVVPTEQPAHKP